MSPDGVPDTLKLNERTALFNCIAYQVYKALLPYIEQIENRSSGHIFGRRVLAHMVELKEAAESITSEECLAPAQRQLLALGLATHDIGRVLCEYDRPGDRTYQHTHGAVGARFLREGSFLADLDPDDADVLLGMIEHHAGKEVALPPNSVAPRLCYLLRDFDKVALLSTDDEYLSPAGAVKQLCMWMLSDDSKAAIASLGQSGTAELHIFLRPILSGECVPEQSNLPKHLEHEIRDALTRDIPEAYLKKVTNGDLMSKDEMISGYPAYMLANMALLNDVRSKSVRAKIEREGLLDSRIKYLHLVSPLSSSAIATMRQRV